MITVSADGKTVDFTLTGDPQVYTLTYDFNTLVMAEEKIGVNLMQALMGGGSAAMIRALLYAFALKKHPVLTLEEAGDVFSKESGTVMTALGFMLRQFSAGIEEEQDDKGAGEGDDAEKEKIPSPPYAETGKAETVVVSPV